MIGRRRGQQNDASGGVAGPTDCVATQSSRRWNLQCCYYYDYGGAMEATAMATLGWPWPWARVGWFWCLVSTRRRVKVRADLGWICALWWRSISSSSKNFGLTIRAQRRKCLNNGAEAISVTSIPSAMGRFTQVGCNTCDFQALTQSKTKLGFSKFTEKNLGFSTWFHCCRLPFFWLCCHSLRPIWSAKAAAEAVD